jgi:hypothetical protein
MTLAAVAVAGGPGILTAQNGATVDSFPPIVSMGLPHAYRPYGGFGIGFSPKGPGNSFLTRAMVGIYRDIANPIPGFAGLAAEGWLGTKADEVDGGARLMFAMPATGLQIGADYSVRLGRVDLAVNIFQPLARGGILIPGGGLRLDWAPARGYFTASLAFPLFQRYAGKTRPKAFEVTPIDEPAGNWSERLEPGPSLTGTLDEVHRAALWVTRLTIPYFPRRSPEVSLPEDSLLARHMATRDSAFPDGHSVAAEVEAYHQALEEAFSLAATGTAALGSGLGPSVSDAARRILLDELLIPYDRNLGQIRQQGVLEALCNRAARQFEAWLEQNGQVPPARRDTVAGVYHALLATVQAMADTTQGRWVDSRMTWLPLQLALRPEEHDTQSELDTILERITGQPFQRGNDYAIATDEAFVAALDTSILEAEDYHVLWIHDFRGNNDEGLPDTLSQQTVIGGYIEALVRAARRFDEQRSVPTFLIFLDEYYYKTSLSERWLELLQDPLGFDFRTKRQFAHIEVAVRAAQDSLRAAVASSPALQQEVARRGEDWLRHLFSVHVSITNPPDPSFRSPAIPGLLPPSTPDDIMRDHRKIAFADITELDPARGVAILSGLGVGGHYAHKRWIDRTIVLRGPAALTIKTEARALLLSQGFSEEEVPLALMPIELPSDRDHRIEQMEVDSNWFARAAIVMNATGYGPKHATAAKAALYTLMPPGSLIWLADPQWLNRYWGGMLLGSAIRGSRVMILGPGPENTAFLGAFVQMSLQRELFLRLTQAREILEQPIEQSGGMLKVGLWKTGLGAHDVQPGLLAMLEGMERYPFILDVLSFHPTVRDTFEYYGERVREGIPTRCPPEGVDDYHPKFHLKMQFFATRETLQDAIGHPEWATYFERRIVERVLECRTGTDIILPTMEPLVPYLEGRSPEERERQVSYLIVGSHNMDLRSFFLDGEAIGLVAGRGALLAVGDLLVLSTVEVEWVDGPKDIDENFPYVGDTKAAAARELEAIF